MEVFIAPTVPHLFTTLNANAALSRLPHHTTLAGMHQPLFISLLVFCFMVSGSCTCAAACDESNSTLSSEITLTSMSGPTTLKATSGSYVTCVVSSFSTYSDHGRDNSDDQDTMRHHIVPPDIGIDQSSNTTSAVAYTSNQALITVPVNIDHEIGPAFSRYYFAVEVLEGAPDIDLLVVFALEAYGRQQYWLASVSAIAVLLKILKSVNIAVKFTTDTTQSSAPSLGTLLQPSHVQEACASLAVHAPTGLATINMFTISTHSRVASDVTHGAVIVPSIGAGTAPHTGPYYTNSTTPSYTVHAVYT
jgi:hypothetical protein